MMGDGTMTECVGCSVMCCRGVCAVMLRCGMVLIWVVLCWYMCI